MANTSISITWYDAQANTTDTYTHELSDANYDRILTYFRNQYAQPDPLLEPSPANPLIPASKNKARKSITRDTIQTWKDLARNAEIQAAVTSAAANVAPIDSVEVNPTPP